MATTIQVQEDTLHFLKQLREQYESPSYDALIKILVARAMKPQQSLWGKGGKISMKEIMKELRDKSERY